MPFGVFRTLGSLGQLLQIDKLSEKYIRLCTRAAYRSVNIDIRRGELEKAVPENQTQRTLALEIRLLRVARHDFQKKLIVDLAAVTGSFVLIQIILINRIERVVNHSVKVSETHLTLVQRIDRKLDGSVLGDIVNHYVADLEMVGEQLLTEL